MTRASFAEQELQAPFIMLDTWDELELILNHFGGQPELIDELQQRQHAWFNSYMDGIRARVVSSPAGLHKNQMETSGIALPTSHSSVSRYAMLVSVATMNQSSPTSHMQRPWDTLQSTRTT